MFCSVLAMLVTSTDFSEVRVFSEALTMPVVTLPLGQKQFIMQLYARYIESG